MKSECIQITLRDNPLEVIKGCTALLGSLSDDFVETIYSEQGIKVISDILTDAVTRLDEEMKRCK